jgi:hypothetical protein
MRRALLLSLALVACDSAGDGGGGGGPGDGPGSDGGGAGAGCGDGVLREGAELCDGDDLGERSCQTLGFSTGQLSCREDCTLDTSGCLGEGDEYEVGDGSGCEGIFNPDQVLTYHVTGSIASDGPGTFRCGDGATLDVEVEVKRGGGFKIDFNQYDDAQMYFGMKKLVFDDGGGADALDIVRQYLSWRLMGAAGVVASRAALARVYVGGDFLGLLVVIEAVDKRMLKNRFGDDDGWLYKKSGGEGDGLKTHEADGLADDNPYDDYLCFWKSNGCEVPGDLESELPGHLHIPQFLAMGAVNALVANSDSPIFKDNNYYHYDWPGTRYYLPWDLDTVMKDSGFGMVQEQSFASVLFTHWEDDYRALAADLLSGPLALDAIHGEIDRAMAAATDGIEDAGGDASAIADDLTTWWTDRHAAAAGQL